MQWETFTDMNDEPRGYELHDPEPDRHLPERYFIVGVYGKNGVDRPEDGQWYVWRNGRAITEGMEIEEAKSTAIALYRLGEI